jgi:hypothetical protein
MCVDGYTVLVSSMRFTERCSHFTRCSMNHLSCKWGKKEKKVTTEGQKVDDTEKKALTENDNGCGSLLGN